jgi:hypothetical protein
MFYVFFIKLISPVVNRINILQAAFALIFLHKKNCKAKQQLEKTKALWHKKVAHKMLMKLTPGLQNVTAGKSICLTE